MDQVVEEVDVSSEEEEEEARPIKRPNLMNRQPGSVRIRCGVYFCEVVDLDFVAANSIRLVMMLGTKHREIEEQPEHFTLIHFPVLDDPFFDWIPELVRGVSILTQFKEQNAAILIQADHYELGLTMLVPFCMQTYNLSYTETIELMDDVGLDVEMSKPFYNQVRLYQMMEGVVDLHNRCYRQFLYACFVFDLWRSDPILSEEPNPIESLRHHLPRFFTMVDSKLNKDPVEDHVLHYCCRNCNIMLFSQRSVVEGMEWGLSEENDDDMNEIVEQCLTLIVEPLHWMLDVTNSIEEFQICCIRCRFPLGIFDPCGFQCHHVERFGECANHPLPPTRLFALFRENLCGAKFYRGQVYEYFFLKL